MTAHAAPPPRHLEVPHGTRRRIVNKSMEVVAWLSAITAVGILGLVVWSIASKGWSELSLDLITKPPIPFSFTNAPQGLANAFAGTIVIVTLATLMAVPIGIMVALYLNEFARPSIRTSVGLITDILAGVPAIVIGVFVYSLLVAGGGGQSGWKGAFALAILMLPFVTRTTVEVLALVPNSLREASLGLGVPRWRTTTSIVVPRAIGGILTGTVLAVARVAGETAPLLFTSSLVGSQVSFDPTKPLQTVPVAIFELSESPDPKDHARAWAAGFVLLMFILAASLTARWLATRNARKIAGR
jgi:phosphate transport system permease protein